MNQTQESWNSTAKFLHWLIFILVLVEVPAGFMMTWLYGPGLKHEDVRPLAHLMGQIHHTNGFFILFFVILRLLWRFAHPGPLLPASLPPLQRQGARITQALLYLLLLAIPLSGWMALSVLADSEAFGKTQIWFFTTSDLVPRILSPRPWNAPDGYGYYAKFHRWFLVVGGLLLAVHVLAALWHQFSRRDRVLGSMWPAAEATRRD